MKVLIGVGVLPDISSPFGPPKHPSIKKNNTGKIVSAETEVDFQEGSETLPTFLMP